MGTLSVLYEKKIDLVIDWQRNGKLAADAGGAVQVYSPTVCLN
jgi:hypothetical protein